MLLKFVRILQVIVEWSFYGIKIHNTCFIIKKGGNRTKYDITLFPKAWGVWQCFFCWYIHSRRQNIGILMYLALHEWFTNIFSQVFTFALVIVRKTYRAVYLSVYGESVGANFFSVEGWAEEVGQALRAAKTLYENMFCEVKQIVSSIQFSDTLWFLSTDTCEISQMKFALIIVVW